MIPSVSTVQSSILPIILSESFYSQGYWVLFLLNITSCDSVTWQAALVTQGDHVMCPIIPIITWHRDIYTGSIYTDELLTIFQYIQLYAYPNMFLNQEFWECNQDIKLWQYNKESYNTKCYELLKVCSIVIKCSQHIEWAWRHYGKFAYRDYNTCLHITLLSNQNTSLTLYAPLPIVCMTLLLQHIGMYQDAAAFSNQTGKKLDLSNIYWC